MLRFLRPICIVASIVVMYAAPASGCEDEHPPILATPVERFSIGEVARGDIVKLAFDPRGVGMVVPHGDDADRWIDTEDEVGAWHYREWQWWKGHPWGESCRPRFYAEVTLKAMRGKHRGATIIYQIDGFSCRQHFRVPDTMCAEAPYWDLVTTIQNRSGYDVEEYGQFYACYTELNRNRSFWYWDETGKLVRFADRNVRHLDGYVVHPSAYFLKSGAIPHCPRGSGRIVGRWRKPVMVSHASPAGWRSVVLIEPTFAGALTQGIEGRAMDYILFPSAGERSFANGGTFSVHIRHVMLKSPELPVEARLEELWAEFERSHTAIKKLAARSSS